MEINYKSSFIKYKKLKVLNKLIKYAQHFVKLELMKARLEVFQNESANRGVEFIVKTETGNFHELYLQPINLEKDRSVKIPK